MQYKEKDTPKMPRGFDPFSWSLGRFCWPIVLWPLALLISPNLMKNSELNYGEMVGMSVFLWTYPFILGIIARILFKLNQRNPKKAKKSLIISALVFWLIVIYIAVRGFN
ncbi:MAG: DUF5389 domain-containing protein [Lonepinella koalarum]|nr:DUF5389 domain-containing protein [Lonepinella koalarum]